MTRPPPTDGELARALAEFFPASRPEFFPASRPESFTGDVEVRPLAGGLINTTFAVTAGGDGFILQRVHPVFAPEIHHNIVAVTEHLRRRGELAPLLLRARDGRPWLDLGPGGIWRAMTRIPGVSFDAVQGLAQARAAGALVARFHSALADLGHVFQAGRAGVHDTPAHLRTLAVALAEHREHRLFPELEPLAAAITTGAADLPPPEPAPLRPCHGDLKFNNILFAGTGPEDHAQTRCLIDLDTVAPMGLHHELGDAWRSWCNRAGEDRGAPSFDGEVFAASLDGYLGALTFPLTPAERRNLVHGVEWISLELAARFAADALNERYFGWDPAHFPAAGEHNLQRARGQWALHRACLAARDLRADLLLR